MNEPKNTPPARERVIRVGSVWSENDHPESIVEVTGKRGATLVLARARLGLQRNDGCRSFPPSLSSG